MANIAQMVNVLQSMILTRGEKMIVTPTYHVFDLYQGHQGAKLLPTQVSAPDYLSGDVRVPAISVSSSRADSGVITVSVVNLNPKRAARIELDIHGSKVAQASGRVIAATTLDAHPDFEKPDPLGPAKLAGISLRDARVYLTAPSASVVVVELR